MENGEYTPSTLCDSLNSEIQSKFPSTFRPNQIRFIFNPVCNRTEIRIDGGTGVKPIEERACLIVFNPLLNMLGFTRSTDENANFIFGSPMGKVKPDQISQASHSTSQYPPSIRTSHLLFIFLDILDQQVSEV